MGGDGGCVPQRADMVKTVGYGFVRDESRGGGENAIAVEGVAMDLFIPSDFIEVAFNRALTAYADIVLRKRCRRDARYGSAGLGHCANYITFQSEDKASVNQKREVPAESKRHA